MDTSTSHLKKRLCVLGAGGQIGSALMARLQVDFPDAEVVGCVRKERASTSAATHLRFHPFTDDWRVLGHVDVLINSIGIIEETADLTFEKAHQGLTRLMLENRSLMGNPKLIQISVLGADTESYSPFLSTKAKADESLLEQPRTVVIRPSIVCTPGTVMVQKLRMLGRISRRLGGYLPFPARFAQTRIQPVLADDLARLVSILCATDQHPSLIAAVGPRTYSLWQLIRYVGQRPIQVLTFPQAWFNTLFPVGAWLLPGLLNPGQLHLLEHDNVADVHVFQELLGRQTGSTKQFWRQELRRF
jgi:NADH dehydrogenase